VSACIQSSAVVLLKQRQAKFVPSVATEAAPGFVDFHFDTWKNRNFQKHPISSSKSSQFLSELSSTYPALFEIQLPKTLALTLFFLCFFNCLIIYLSVSVYLFIYLPASNFLFPFPFSFFPFPNFPISNFPTPTPLLTARSCLP